MTAKSVLFTLALVIATAGAGVAAAADSNDTAKNPPDRTIRQNRPDKDQQQGGMMGNGMMGGGMGNGMMGGGMGGGMMGGGMMGHGMMGMDSCGSASAHLPPGNEKLELKMRAEIMQKTGEILAKYADQLLNTTRTP